MKIYGLLKEQIIPSLKRGEIKIEVFGLGKMGLPLALAFAEAGCNVVGVDLNSCLVEQINRGQNPFPFEEGLTDLLSLMISKKKLWAATEPVEADVYITLVPTILDQDMRPDLTQVENVMRVIARLLKPGDLVIEESTLPPGTCENKLYPILLSSGLSPGSFGFAHCPERTSSGRALKDIKGAYPKIVGGIDPQSTEAASALYSAINSSGVVRVSSITAAEAVKVFEGIYRDTNIALANELALLSRNWKIDVIEVIAAANTQPYSHIHRPGAGVGGHCIPVYPYFVNSLKEADLIRVARARNEEMPRIVAQMALEELEKAGVPFKEARVILLGIAFRPGVKEDRYSPFFGVRDYLKGKAIQLYALDPLYSPEEISALDVSFASSLEGMDCAIIITDHPEFCRWDWQREAKKMRHPILVDGRFIVDPELGKEKLILRRIDGR